MKYKKIIIIFILALFFVNIIAIYLVFKSKPTPAEYLEQNSGLSIMYETEEGSGQYTKESATTWDTEEYVFNKEKSYCENGSTLSWDSESQTILLPTYKSDNCIIYFDKKIKFMIYDELDVSIVYDHGASLYIDINNFSYQGSYQISTIYMVINNSLTIEFSDIKNLHTITPHNTWYYGENITYKIYAVTTDGIYSNYVEGNTTLLVDSGGGN